MIQRVEHPVTGVDCDGCEAHLPLSATSTNAARTAAHRHGWISGRGLLLGANTGPTEDLCPRCADGRRHPCGA